MHTSIDSFAAIWRRRGTAACSGLLLGLSGIGFAIAAEPQPGKPLIYADECRLGTESKDSQPYHALVYYPNEYALRVPGVVIGTEKSSADAVRRGAQTARLAVTPDGIERNERTSEWLTSLFRDSRKSMFISHVAAFDGQSGHLVFDAYRDPVPADERAIDPSVKQVPWLDCKGRPITKANAFADSWRGVRAARERIRSDLAAGQYTHVFVIAMGWNTVQIEAMQNYASIARTLQATAKPGERFKPYLIGFTWPSQWDNSFLPEVVVRTSSLGNKANDADEFAAGWLGASLRYAVIPALAEHRKALKNEEERPKVIAIGHSFGARAMSHAICRGGIFVPADPELLATSPLGAGAVDALISLQGAYSLNRFRAAGAGPSELAYASGCPAATRLVFTASKHDEAAEAASKLPGPLWAGSIKSWKALQKAGSEGGDELKFAFCTAPSSGKLGEGSCKNPHHSRFYYVDASELIKFQSFGTGGGAHSDIYKNEAADFIRWAMGL